MAEEIKLLQASIDGDTAAFEQIVKKYQSLVCAITFSGTGRVDISEELAQETFLSAWKNLCQLKELSEFRAWLCTIARNLLNNYYRKKKPVSLESANLAEIADQTPTPSEILISQEEQVMLEQALMQIPAEYREPLVMFYRQGQSSKEVAEALDLNESTIRTRLHRARQMLREEVAKRLEQTLQQTAPGKTFTKAVMVGIGATLAAGAAGTASAAAGTIGAASATGSSASILSATSTVLGTLAGKIIVAAAAVAITAGLAAYFYNQMTEKNTTANQSKSVPSVGPQTNIDNDNNNVPTSMALKPVGQTEEPTNSQIAQVEQPEPEVKTQTQNTFLASSRHPDWPGLGEPVNNIYIQKSGSGIVKSQLWIRLLRKYRQEDKYRILIDNSKHRIEVNKKEKTVQLSEILTNTDGPRHHYDFPLATSWETQCVYWFGRPRTEIKNSTSANDYKYTINKIGEQNEGAVTIYKLLPDSEQDTYIYIKAYVDSQTLLPEGFEYITFDPNSVPKERVVHEKVYDFSVIDDSVFEYTVKNDETMLPFRQWPCFRGQVVDTTGNPVVGAEIFIHPIHWSNRGALTGKSDIDGKFEIKLSNKPNETHFTLPVHYRATLPDDPGFVAWTVLATEVDYSRCDIRDYVFGYGGDIIQTDSKPGKFTGSCDGETFEYETINKGKIRPVIENILLVMEPAGVIGGYVTDDAGNAIAGAKIKAGFMLVDGDGTISPTFSSYENRWTFETVSGEDGSYELTGIPVLWKGCRFTIDISAEGYVEEIKNFFIDAPIDYKEYNIELNPQLITIAGVLKDNYGKPLASRNVHLFVPDMQIWNYSTRTDPNGIFILEGCPDMQGMHLRSYLSTDRPGESSIESITNEQLEWYLFYPDVSKTVPYSAGQSEYFVELTAIRPERKVEVAVVDSAGKPISEFKVKLDGYLQKPGKLNKSSASILWEIIKLEKRTDNNGQVIFDNVPNFKEMTVVVSAYQRFDRELVGIYDNQKEYDRLEKIDEIYKEKYHETRVPVEVVDGRIDYYIEAVVLTKEEFNSLAEIVQQD